jgi:nicotinamide-nucleotide amidase
MYDVGIINAIKEFLVKNKQTLAVAESVTSGHLQAAFSLADGATMFFQGGITAYNLGQKSRHLLVDPISAEACNCVSEKVTEQMALRVGKLFSSSLSIAATGYAAPVPEIGIQDLFAFVSIACMGKIIQTKKITASKQASLNCQLYYTNEMLREFERVLQNQMALQIQ